MSHPVTFAEGRINLSGVELELDPSLSFNMREAISSGGYERSERDMVEAAIRPWDSVVELGAGIGLLSTLCAQKVGSHKVHAYEANPAMIPLIRNTYRRNGVKPFLHNAIFGERQGEQTFYLHPDFWLSSTVQNPVWSSLPTVQVPMVSGSEVLAEVKPSFLICDIEGGEADLFKTLELPQETKKLLVETHPRVIGVKGVDRLLADFYAVGFELGATSGDVWFLCRS